MRRFLLLAFVSTSSAVDLTEFRPSRSQATFQQAFGSLAGRLNHERDDTLQADDASHIKVTGGYYWYTETRSDSSELGLRLVPAGIVLLSEDRLLARRRGDGSVALMPDVAWRHYLGKTDFSLAAELSPDISFQHRWSLDSTQTTKQTTLGAGAEGQVGPGWGRMRDAWPLLRATRILDILAEEGALEREPGDVALQDLAAFMSRSWQLFRAHERPAKFYYDSLEAWLVASGAITGPLPARALFRLDEYLGAGSYQRPFGFRVEPLLSFGGSWRREWYDAGGNRSTDDDAHGSYAPFLRAKWARPVGLRWLFTADAELWPDGPWRTGDGREHKLDVSARAAWSVLDRLDVSVSPRFESRLGPDAGGRLVYSGDHALGVGFEWYLAERLDLHCSTWWSSEYAGGARTWRSHWSFQVKLELKPVPGDWLVEDEL